MAWLHSCSGKQARRVPVSKCIRYFSPILDLWLWQASAGAREMLTERSMLSRGNEVDCSALQPEGREHASRYYHERSHTRTAMCHPDSVLRCLRYSMLTACGKMSHSEPEDLAALFSLWAELFLPRYTHIGHTVMCNACREPLVLTLWFFHSFSFLVKYLNVPEMRLKIFLLESRTLGELCYYIFFFFSTARESGNCLALCLIVCGGFLFVCLFDL